jgi:hypothetical protein
VLALGVGAFHRRDEQEGRDDDSDGDHDEDPDQPWRRHECQSDRDDQHERCVEQEQDAEEDGVRDVGHVGAQAYEQVPRTHPVEVAEREVLDARVGPGPEGVCRPLREEDSEHGHAGQQDAGGDPEDRHPDTGVHDDPGVTGEQAVVDEAFVEGRRAERADGREHQQHLGQDQPSTVGPVQRQDPAGGAHAPFLPPARARVASTRAPTP